jgi:hypothetical protein
VRKIAVKRRGRGVYTGARGVRGAGRACVSSNVHKSHTPSEAKMSRGACKRRSRNCDDHIARWAVGS